MSVPPKVDESGYDRRLLALLFLVFLVIMGAGVGTIAFPGTDDDGNESTPTPDVVTVTPVTPTPADPPATPVDTATPTPNASPTPTEATRDDRDDDDDDRTETPSPTPTATPTLTESDSSNGGDPPSVDLTADGSTVLVEASNVSPDTGGQSSITFENSGDATGRLVADDTTLAEYENSLLDPEAAVGDDATTGELASALRVRLSVTYPDGTTEYLFGSASGHVTLESLDGENRTSNETLAGGEQATVTLEWTLPASTGNAVQSDSAEFDVDFVLEQTS